MDQPQIHFEVFARRPGSTHRRLELASEDRAAAIEAAEELLASGEAASVQVSKEILYPGDREFKSVVIFDKGAPARAKVRKPVEQAPLCVGPADLYTTHARMRIAELLQPWLARHKVTAYELLHRPDLVEKLEATGVELQHAIQKVALPESQARGQPVHQLIRHFQALFERSVCKLMKDAREGQFADLRSEAFAAACRRCVAHPDAEYVLGGAVAARMGQASGWAAKVDLLLDMADGAPADGPSRALAFAVLAQPLGELLSTRVGLQELLGAGEEFGDSMAALTRLAAGPVIETLIRADPGLGAFLPALPPTADRLARCLREPMFDEVRLALGARLLREIATPKRLRPGDPRAEIETLRALAKALTTASGPLLPLDAVREAFTHRSKTLVSSDFVGLLQGEHRPALNQAQDLVWLLDNVTGPANKRGAAQRLHAHVSSLRFETELRTGPEPALARLHSLARLQWAIVRGGADIPESMAAAHVVGAIGGQIEAQAQVIATIVKAHAPIAERLIALLRLATGETAPEGPALDRARVQALKLLRCEEARALLTSGSDEVLAPIHHLLRAYQAARPRAA